MDKISELDYNSFVSLIGTAYFTKRSIDEAYIAVQSSEPKNIALELDWERYTQLNSACPGCPKHKSCSGFCEFTVASDALGNVNSNIWLIDMTQREMRHRLKKAMSSTGIHQMPNQMDTIR